MAGRARNETADNYRALFNNQTIGLAYCKTVFDDQGKAVDYVLVDVNDTWLSLVGVERARVVGKRITEAFPGVSQDLVDRHNRVAVTGQSTHFETYESTTSRWYEVDVVSPRSGYFIALVHNITDRKQAEKAAHDSEASLRGVLDNSRDVIVSFDLIENRYEYVSPSVFDLVGYTPEEFIGMSRQEALRRLHIDDLDAFRRATQACEETGQAEVEYRQLARDGRWVWVSNRMSVLRYADGRPYRRISNLQDITERRKAEDALKESQERYRALTETTSDFIWEMDTQGHYTYCSPQMQALWGLRPEEMVGKTPFDMMPPGDRQKAVEYFKAVAGTGAPFSGLVTSAYDAQGQPIFVETSGIPFFDAEGVLLGFRGVSRDITERKNAEQKVLNERKRLFNVLETLPTMVCLMTPDYHVAFANRGFREKFGEARGRHCYEYVWGLAERCPFCESFKPLETGEPHHWVCTSPDGESVIDVYDEPFIDADGSQLILEMDVDITERTKNEKRVVSLNRELRAITECNQAMVRARDEVGLMQDVCRIMCDSAGYRMAWVGAVENGETKLVRPVAWGGAEDGYLAASSITWADTEYGRGPTGVAARTGMTDFCQDFTTDPRTAVWRDSALERGYRSSVALPLKDAAGNTTQVFTLYRGEPNWFTPDEVRLLEELAGDLAFGIGVLRNRHERRRALEGLRETRDYLDSLINYANAPIIVWNPDFEITRFNHAFEQLTGRSSAEMLGKRVDMLIPEGQRADAMAHISRATVKGERWEVVEIPIQHVDGSIRTLLWNSATIFGPDDKTLIATIAQGQDITERKKVEDALMESQERFAQAFHANSCALAITSEDTGEFVEVNNAFEALSGFTRRELIGRTSRDLNFYIDPRQREMFVARLRADNGFRDAEVDFRDRYGNVVHTLYSMQRISIASRPLILSTVINVTERKRAEERVRQSETLLRSIIDGVPDPVYVKDRSSRILIANPALARVVGKPLAELIGKTDSEYYGSDRVGQELRSHDLEVMETGRGISTEETVPTPDGERTFVSNKVPYLNTAGEVIGVVGVSHDITELKKVDQIKDEFIGMVSHELKTPLTVVTGALSVAMTDGLPLEDQRTLLRDAVWGADTMADIVDNLLELSRWQANRLVLQPAPLDVGQVIATVVQQLAGKSRQHRLLANVSSGLPQVPADRTRIVRILENLIDNAIKYSPNGGEVSVSARLDGDHVLVSVSDRGIGIAPEDAERLFQPFSRLEAAVPGSAAKGVGLGLVVCKRLVEAHRGRIWVESRPGQGATFSFTLPL